VAAKNGSKKWQQKVAAKSGSKKISLTNRGTNKLDFY
jgi:hypothetical protein